MYLRQPRLKVDWWHLVIEGDHSFIVRVWLEELAEDAGQGAWRGNIIHVASGKRRYLRELNDITEFIAPYLLEWGVDSGMGGRVKRWWNQHTRK